MAATIKDISKNTGLGLGTISKYLNGGKVREKNRIAIEKAISELDYTVNEFARSLKTNKSKTVGIVVPEITGNFFTYVISEIEAVLRKENYAAITCDCRTDNKLEKEAIEFVLSKKVDGLINFAVNPTGTHLKPALEQHIPIILIDRMIPRMKGFVDSVSIDNAGITHEVTKHLLEQGHRDIGIIIGPENVITANKRLEGYCAALEEKGIPVNSKYITRGEYSLESGLNGFQRLMSQDPKPTALFATSNDLTLGALIAINDGAYKVPDDISFVGFDCMEWARITVPKLTIVSQPMAQIGHLAAEIMLARLANGGAAMKPRHEIISAMLIMGDSIKRIQA